MACLATASCERRSGNLLVERLAGVGDEGGGNGQRHAVGLDLRGRPGW